MIWMVCALLLTAALDHIPDPVANRPSAAAQYQVPAVSQQAPLAAATLFLRPGGPFRLQLNPASHEPDGFRLCGVTIPRIGHVADLSPPICVLDGKLLSRT
jgi:hypothetical protein